MPRSDLTETKRSSELMFCGKCGTEIKEDDGYCVKCGNKAVKKKEQTEQSEQSVNNWTDLYQSAKKSSKKTTKESCSKKRERRKTSRI